MYSCCDFDTPFIKTGCVSPAPKLEQIFVITSSNRAWWKWLCVCDFHRQNIKTPWIPPHFLRTLAFATQSPCCKEVQATLRGHVREYLRTPPAQVTEVPANSQYQQAGHVKPSCSAPSSAFSADVVYSRGEGFLPFLLKLRICEKNKCFVV